MHRFGVKVVISVNLGWISQIIITHLQYRLGYSVLLLLVKFFTKNPS